MSKSGEQLQPFVLGLTGLIHSIRDAWGVVLGPVVLLDLVENSLPAQWTSFCMHCSDTAKSYARSPTSDNAGILLTCLAPNGTVGLYARIHWITPFPLFLAFQHASVVQATHI